MRQPRLACRSPQRNWQGRARALLIPVLVLPLIAPVSARSDHDPRAWLNRMDQAVEFLNYEGTLVHMRPGHSATFRIYHRVENGVVTERLVAMDGAGAEIIRNQDEVTCILPEQNSVVVEKRREKDSSQSPLRASLPDYSEEMEDYYELELMPAERIAGHSTRVVVIRPKDRFRYGYRLWLDEETAMPLKSQLRSEENDEPVEEILFTEIVLPESIPEESVQPSLPTDAYTWVKASDIREQDLPEAERRWRARDLPPGFRLTSNHVEFIGDSEIPRIHMVYMDGLVSVSVFVDAGVAASEQAEGFSEMGAANAYSRAIKGHLVTAVGQVPGRTVEAIALSIEPLP